jgi:hypothetical protein
MSKNKHELCVVAGCTSPKEGLFAACAKHFMPEEVFTTRVDNPFPRLSDPKPVVPTGVASPKTMSEKYPKYFKDVSEIDEIDVYHVHKLFEVDDPSGCIHHSSKKLLLCGKRTGEKPKHKDVAEARDTLTRWLQLNGHE